MARDRVGLGAGPGVTLTSRDSDADACRGPRRKPEGRVVVLFCAVHAQGAGAGGESFVVKIKTQELLGKQ